VGDDEDAALMLEVARGDRRAFATLFDRHQAGVVRFCWRFVGTQAQAEELAQDIFIKLFRSAKSYQPSAKFKTFLYRVATNHCLNAMRGPSAKLEVTVDTTERALEPAGSATTPGESLEGKQLEAVVQKALSAMSERERAAFCMCRFEGLAYKEIAVALSATEAAVKSLIHRATLTVAKHLEAMHGRAGVEQLSG
jgi:RNA polymerase sigma-70 factor (ECF subfamily)